MSRLAQIATVFFRSWSARRHGRDSLPITINRRRIYILPTRFGLTLAVTLFGMLLAGLNYNSNLGLALVFLLASAALVAMHHCHRNLLGLSVDVNPEADTFAGAEARFDFTLLNESAVDRCDIEIRCAAGTQLASNVAPGTQQWVTLAMPVTRRGVIRLKQFELRSRYPFGWFRAWTYVQAELTAFVAPEPRGLRMPPCIVAGDGVALPESRGDEDFAGLRAYEPGIPLKHMAWKVLARGGEAVVRSYSSQSAQPEWLEWSSLDGMEKEARLSQMCRWVINTEAAHRRYGLRLPGIKIAPARGPAHCCACLRVLAQFESGTDR